MLICSMKDFMFLGVRVRLRGTSKQIGRDKSSEEEAIVLFVFSEERKQLGVKERDGGSKKWG